MKILSTKRKPVLKDNCIQSKGIVRCIQSFGQKLYARMEVIFMEHSEPTRNRKEKDLRSIDCAVFIMSMSRTYSQMQKMTFIRLRQVRLKWIDLSYYNFIDLTFFSITITIVVIHPSFKNVI